MAKVPKGQTIYTRGPTYKAGDECPDELLPEAPKVPLPKPKTKEPKKDK